MGSDPIIYFAYGSNMSSRRLIRRVGPVHELGIATLDFHRLAFHKISDKDGSGKADVIECASSHVMGVLFRLDQKAKQDLDEHEGLGTGYAEKPVSVIDGQGCTVTALTYCAMVTDPSLKPFMWYLRHLIEGATEAGLPDSYRQALMEIEANEDPDEARTRTELAIYS
jgi:gamma-glutamylcyclotransferase